MVIGFVSAALAQTPVELGPVVDLLPEPDPIEIRQAVHPTRQDLPATLAFEDGSSVTVETGDDGSFHWIERRGPLRRVLRSARGRLAPGVLTLTLHPKRCRRRRLVRWKDATLRPWLEGLTNPDQR